MYWLKDRKKKKENKLCGKRHNKKRKMWTILNSKNKICGMTKRIKRGRKEEKKEGKNEKEMKKRKNSHEHKQERKSNEIRKNIKKKEIKEKKTLTKNICEEINGKTWISGIKKKREKIGKFTKAQRKKKKIWGKTIKEYVWISIEIKSVKWYCYGKKKKKNYLHFQRKKRKFWNLIINIKYILNTKKRNQKQREWMDGLFGLVSGFNDKSAFMD